MNMNLDSRSNRMQMSYKDNFVTLSETIEVPELTEEEFVAALRDSFYERMNALKRGPVNWTKDGF